MKNKLTCPIGFGMSQAGLPIVPIKIGDYELCLIIDTGTILSLIDSRVVDKLGDLVEKEEKSRFILAIDGKYRQVDETATLTFKLEKHSFTHSFICESLLETLIKIEMESDIQVHGILGNDFLLKNKWIIDFDKLEIYSS